MTSTPPDTVHLDLPAHPRFLSAARVLAASIGADAGLSVDDLDDLRLGVNELVSVLIEGAGPDGRVHLELGADASTVTIRGTLDGGATAQPLGADDLTGRILAAVVDRYELGSASFELAKSSSIP